MKGVGFVAAAIVVGSISLTSAAAPVTGGSQHNDSLWSRLVAAEDASATELAGLRLRVSVSTQPKCVRCWHYSADVGESATHPELCARCVSNVEGSGEQRHFA